MKKILAIILSLMLIMSMGAVAFATQTETTYQEQSTVTISKRYKLVGEGTSPAEQFVLTQTGKEVLDGEATVASVPDLVSITPVSFVEGGATTHGTTEKFTVTLPTYEKVGVYKYTLKETAGTTAGVTYYDGEIVLIVTVINNGDGKLRVAAVHVEEAKDGEYSSDPTSKVDTFENIYSAGALNVTKTVTGILGDKTKYFEFKVSLKGEAGKTYGDSYAVTGGSYETNPTTVTIGTAETPADFTFYLKDGETISIENLPYGVSYTVVEVDANDDGYTTTSIGDTGTIATADQTAAFTNTKGGTPDTGVFVDSLPYILIIAFVAFGGVAMMIKRRRNAEI